LMPERRIRAWFPLPAVAEKAAGDEEVDSVAMWRSL